MDMTSPIYTNAESARIHLESIRWPDGPVCPHCGSISKDHYALKGKTTRPGLYKCKDCQQPFTVTVGTVFERSKVPLNKWILAAHLMAASKKGISAHQLHRMLGVTYKTAWFMEHRLREAMNIKPTGPLGSGGGTVEADETYWGNKKPYGKGPRGPGHKMKIVSLVERNGQVRSFHVPNVTGKTLKPILTAQIAKDANLMTDEASQYVKIGRHFASHQSVSHGRGEYVRGAAYTNTVEGYFSILKRGLVGTFHHVNEKHLQRYVTEFDFRYNHRASLGINDAERGTALLKSIGGKRLRYY
jgi:transposase-like protein